MTNKVTVPFTCLLDISRKRQQLQARQDTNAIPDNILFVRLDPLRFWQNWLRYLCRGNPKTIYKILHTNFIRASKADILRALSYVYSPLGVFSLTGGKR